MSSGSITLRSSGGLVHRGRAKERVNGMLQKFPTNHHPDEIPKTLTHKWHMHSTLKSLLNGAAVDKHLAED
ncbi:hypothetical protein PTTG_26959 [Puccinia triticina 1-1 BBBD Race 1]|uniref:Uncharacterized protein n=1 Tax=Puccinia triticina (isolate 1-1 / race 1 (BBBD)) TaxID=630390 RepID=A0A180GNY6_PUCT1|nr:hypothetical protein PTTG_26959 [Puccinia triticina 1-1 BBBD Race 1]